MSAFAANPIDLKLEQLFGKRFIVPKITPPFTAPQIISVPFAAPGSGPAAARLGDEIAHSLARLGALIGFLAAAVVAVAAVAIIVATGGAALVVVAAVGAGMAAAGAAGQAGAKAGSKHMGPTTGVISMPPMHTVFINNKMAVNATMSQTPCSKEPSLPLRPIAMGSDSVDTLSFPSARKGDKVKCGATISGACSSNVFIGGGQKATMLIDDELPAWASWGLNALVVVGTTITILASAGIVAGAVATGGAIAGGVATVKLGAALLIGKGMQKAGSEGAKLGASALGYEEGSFANDMSGIVGGEVAGLIKTPKGIKTRFTKTKFAQYFNQRYTKAYNRATDTNTKLGKWNAKTQVRAQNIKTGANKAIIASVLSAQLRMSKPKIGPNKPPTPKVIAAGTRPSTPKLVRNSSAPARIKGVSAKMKVKYDGGTGTFTAKGIKSTSKIIPAKPTITVTYKKAFPSNLVTKNKWMSVKTKVKPDIEAKKTTAKKPPKKKSNREIVLGRTPGKTSKTGREVRERMRAEGTVKVDPETGKDIFLAENGKWYPVDSPNTHMGHNPKDAVDYWNTEGIKHGPKSKEVREWMLNSDNYRFEYGPLNSARGGATTSRYNMEGIDTD